MTAVDYARDMPPNCHGDQALDDYSADFRPFLVRDYP